MPELAPITVVVVDDHPMVRQGICAFLGTQPDIAVVAEAASSGEAVQRVAELRPAIALMDLQLPDADGIETAERIQRLDVPTRVLLLTSFHDDTHVRRAIQAKVAGYLLKDVEPSDLATAVRKAARGELILSPRVAEQLARSAFAPVNPKPALPLSGRELEVLRLVAQGMSNARIADELMIGEKTVKTHVSSILTKLDLADRTQATAFAWREGLIDRA
ncbi:MAG: response regulator transcription factor [Fimbriimonadaceae bacterium]|nr:response regulator transcription factor [Fimbriimonadaceae bacterium]